MAELKAIAERRSGLLLDQLDVELARPEKERAEPWQFGQHKLQSEKRGGDNLQRFAAS